MPDHAISKIQDPITREAIMLLRTELFSLVERNETQIGTLASKIEIYVSNSTAERAFTSEWRTQQLRAIEQIGDSANRIVGELRAQFAAHCVKDEEFQSKVAATFSRSQSWVIGTLITLLLSCFGALSALVMHGLK